MHPTDERLTGYLEAVGGEIRWPRARRLLLGELRDHIDDQARDFEAQGDPAEDALTKAVEEMGDPAAVGRELDRLHRPRKLWGVMVFFLVLVALGFWLNGGGRSGFHSAPVRQMLAAVLGLAGCCGVWFSDYTLLLRRFYWCVGAYFAAVIAGPSLYSFLRFGSPDPFDNWRSLTPLIYLALLFPVVYAALLCRLKGRGATAVLCCSLSSLFPLLFSSLAGHSVVPVMTAVQSCIVSLLLLVLAACTGWFRLSRRTGLVCALVPAGLPLAYWLYRLLTHPRFIAGVLHPELDPLGAGFASMSCRKLIASLPLFSAGNSDSLFLNPHYSMVFSNPGFFLLQLSDIFGRIVLYLAPVITVALTVFALLKIKRLHSRRGRLLALAACLTLSMEAGAYILYNLGFCFSDPVSLPFLSYGTLALMTNFLLLGVILSVFRMDCIVRDGGPDIPHRPLQFSIPLPFHRGTIRIVHEK